MMVTGSSEQFWNLELRGNINLGQKQDSNKNGLTDGLVIRIDNTYKQETAIGYVIDVKLKI